MISIEQARTYSDMGVEKLEIVKKVLEKAPRGVFCEIGVRKGGTALMALNTDNCELLVCIDPYLPFNDMNGDPIEMDTHWFIETYDLLTNEMKKLGKFFWFFKQKSKDYIDIDNDGSTYSYVLLDGSHVDEDVQREIDHFSERMEPGGVILVDNIDWLKINFDNWEKPRFDMAYKTF